MPSRVENTIMENYASVVLVNLRRVMREPYYDHKCIPELFGFFILCGLQLSFPLLCTALQCIQDLPKIEREKKKNESMNNKNQDYRSTRAECKPLGSGLAGWQ